MYCSKCGSFNSDNNKFCIKCGASLTFNNPISNKSNERVIFKMSNKKASVVTICTLIIIILFSVLIASQLIVKNDSSQLKANEHFSCGMDVIVSVNDDGTVNCEGEKSDNYNLSEWKDIKAVAAGADIIVGLKNNGEVIAVSDNENELLQSFKNDISKWKNICSISFELSTGLLAGVKSDGTVVITGCYNDVPSSLDVSNLKDVTDVNIGVFDGEYPYILALKNNGTVEKIIGSIDGTENVDADVIESFNDLIDVSEFKNIKSIYSNEYNVFGITKSGELKMTFNSDLLEKYFVRPMIIEDNLNNQEKHIADQLIALNWKMFEDMLKRTQKYKISQILCVPDYSVKSVPYYDGFEEVFYFDDIIYLLLDDGTVVTESPYLSLYYYAKDLSGDDLYNKVQEYMNCNYDYDDFLNSWYEYCDACEELINKTSSLRNIVAIDTYFDSEQENQLSLIVMSENGEICVADKFPDISDWENSKTNEKTQKSIVSQINSTTESIETTSKRNTETTTAKTTKSKDENFYKDKYYLYADESGELNIFVLQFYDETVKITVYDNTDDFTTAVYTETYNLNWNKAHDFAKINNETIFIFDDDYKVILYQTANMAKHAALVEYDTISKNDLKQFAEDYY